MERFSDFWALRHLCIAGSRGARRVRAFNTGFFHEGLEELVSTRQWISIAGLLADGTPAIVIPIKGLEQMSDADKLAAITAGMRLARVAGIEKDILDSEFQGRMPYTLEAEHLSLEQFRLRYKAEFESLRRFQQVSDLIAARFRNILAVWQGENEESGFIYCLHDQQGHFKIGLTKQLTQRIKQLSTQPPFKLELICAFRVVNASRYEAILHERYADRRLNGEWFQLSPPELDDFIKENAGEEFIAEGDMDALQNPNGQRLLVGQAHK